MHHFFQKNHVISRLILFRAWGRRPASVFDEIFQLVFYIYVYYLLKIFIIIFAGK